MINSFLNGKIALVTGGSRGIGRATAKRLADDGATVVLCARGKEELRKSVEEIQNSGGQASFITADLAVPHQISTMISEILRSHHRIDILINNASLLGPKVPLSEYPLGEWEDVLKVNLTGLFFLTQKVLRSMVDRKSGMIINLTSSVGRKGRARWGAYSVSKFGVEGLTQVLAEEVRDDNVCVLAINPGATRTRMRGEAYPDENPETLKDPTIVADAISSLIHQGPMVQTGKTLDVQTILGEKKA